MWWLTNLRRTFYGYIIVILACLASSQGQKASDADDQCDHTIWDTTDEPKGVHNIFARCSEGHIAWKHPYGAVRITLQLRNSGTEFKGCFKAKSQFTIAKISLENSRSLKTLVTLNSPRPHMEHELCLQSSEGHITLYIEAQPTDLNSATIGEVLLDYDLEKYHPSFSQDNLEECRPCTEKELLTAFCTSDFVVRGSIKDLLHDKDSEETEIHLKVSKIHRQKSTQFKRSIAHRGRYVGAVIAPYKCGIEQGDGLFVFMGKIRLERAILQCAPRLEEFDSMWRRAAREGRTLCMVE